MVNDVDQELTELRAKVADCITRTDIAIAESRAAANTAARVKALEKDRYRSNRMSGEQRAWVAATFAGVLVVLGIVGGLTYNARESDINRGIAQQQQNVANDQLNARINECIGSGKDPVLCRVAITGTNK